MIGYVVEKAFIDNQYPFILKTFSKLKTVEHFSKLMRSIIIFKAEILEAYSLKAKNGNKCLFLSHYIWCLSQFGKTKIRNIV